jgi:YGGT family
MVNDQPRQPDPENQPTNVVVTTQAPIHAVEREVVLPQAPIYAVEREVVLPQVTRVDVYPPSAVNGNELATDVGSQQLRVRREVVRQRRFGVGKTIDLIWYALGVLEVVLAARFFFELTAANSAAGFVKFIVAIAQPFAWPFDGIFPVPRDGSNVFDVNILVGMAVYVVIVWGITRLLEMSLEPPSVT